MYIYLRLYVTFMSKHILKKVIAYVSNTTVPVVNRYCKRKDIDILDITSFVKTLLYFWVNK